MKSNRKIILLIVTLALMLFPLTGCGPERVPVEKDLDSLELAEGTKLEQSHDIEGIHFVNTYDTGRYDLGTWRITDSKTLSMEVSASNIPEGTQVMIEHMHATVSLKAELAQVDGMKQAEMDDSFHGTSQDGFIITEKYPYKNIFAIDGYSQTLLEGWGYYTGDYGSCSVDEKRLTEKNLINSHEVYANKIQIVYDVMIKNKDDEGWHTVPMIDEFLVKVNTSSKDVENDDF